MTNTVRTTFLAALICGTAAIAMPAIAQNSANSSTTGTKGAMGNTTGAMSNSGAMGDAMAPGSAMTGSEFSGKMTKMAPHHRMAKGKMAMNASEAETTRQLNMEQHNMAGGSSMAGGTGMSGRSGMSGGGNSSSVTQSGADSLMTPDKAAMGNTGTMSNNTPGVH